MEGWRKEGVARGKLVILGHICNGPDEFNAFVFSIYFFLSPMLNVLFVGLTLFSFPCPLSYVSCSALIVASIYSRLLSTSCAGKICLVLHVYNMGRFATWGARIDLCKISLSETSRADVWGHPEEQRVTLSQLGGWLPVECHLRVRGGWTASIPRLHTSSWLNRHISTGTWSQSLPVSCIQSYWFPEPLVLLHTHTVALSFSFFLLLTIFSSGVLLALNCGCLRTPRDL